MTSHTSSAMDKSERRAVATLALFLALVFIANFVTALAMPVLPLQVHEALAAVPSLPVSSPAVLCELDPTSSAN